MKKDDVRLAQKILFIVLLILVLCLSACSSMSEADQHFEVRATWTPAAYPTDQPYEANTDDLSYFGGTPFLVILGSEDTSDEFPLQVQNFSTDDIYDFSLVPSTSADTWSRPIVAENKDVYFQVGDSLYVLSPGGQMRSIKMPYDGENPAYCNWSWKGKLVCLNHTMTVGFLVDRDLNVVEMNLPANSGEVPEAYYEPYRVGENSIRIVQVRTKTVNGIETAFFKELDLETLTVKTQHIRIEADFNGEIAGSGSVEFTQEGGNLDVIGITDDGEKVYLCLSGIDMSTHLSVAKLLVETYDVTTMTLTHNDLEIKPDADMRFYQNYLITALWFDENTSAYKPPVIVDLESGEILKEFLGYEYEYYARYNPNYSIFPYGKGWIFGFSYRLDYHRRNGDLMDRFYFMDDMIDFIGPDSVYTVSQPMEP